MRWLIKIAHVEYYIFLSFSICNGARHPRLWHGFRGWEMGSFTGQEDGPFAVEGTVSCLKIILCMIIWFDMLKFVGWWIWVKYVINIRCVYNKLLFLIYDLS